MPKRPLRAVILDNDETTGSYAIVFGVFQALRVHNVDIYLTSIILERLAVWMVENKVFRPGLVEFLKHIVNLRKEKKIDAIIMYTNQKDIAYIKEDADSWYPPLLHSVAHCIAYMMSYLVEEFVFDHVLSRPDSGILIGNQGCIAKQFKRVLDLYPSFPVSIERCLFFDDLATREIIRVDGIPEEGIYPSAWVQVPAYRVYLTDEQIKLCINTIFYDCNFKDSFIKHTHDIVRKIAPKPISPIESPSLSCKAFIPVIKIIYKE